MRNFNLDLQIIVSVLKSEEQQQTVKSLSAFYLHILIPADPLSSAEIINHHQHESFVFSQQVNK